MSKPISPEELTWGLLAGTLADLSSSAIFSTSRLDYIDSVENHIIVAYASTHKQRGILAFRVSWELTFDLENLPASVEKVTFDRCTTISRKQLARRHNASGSTWVFSGIRAQQLATPQFCVHRLCETHEQWHTDNATKQVYDHKKKVYVPNAMFGGSVLPVRDTYFINQVINARTVDFEELEAIRASVAS